MRQKRMDYLNEFKNYMDRLPTIRSEGTIEIYAANVRNFIGWFKDSYDLDFHKLNRVNVKEYSSYLKNVKGLSNSTINQKLSALAKFNLFLISGNIQEELVITKEDYFPVDRQTINPAKTEKREVTKFRQRILDSSSENAIRDYAIMTLMATTGIRASECVSIMLNDLDLYNCELKITTAKRSKPRVVYLADIAITAIKAYLKVRDVNYKKAVQDSDPHLFVSRQKGKKSGHYGLSRQTLNKITARYKGDSAITPHELRHNFITWAVTPEHEGGGGMSIEAAGAIAGHSSVRTTSIYTNPSIKKMKNKINRYNDSF